jgi:hypothetical protein
MSSMKQVLVVPCLVTVISFIIFVVLESLLPNWIFAPVSLWLIWILELTLKNIVRVRFTKSSLLSHDRE